MPSTSVLPRRSVLVSVLIVLVTALASCSARGAEDVAKKKDEAKGEGTRIVEMLGLEAGDRVADIGAGDGEWTEILAAAVGAEGRVWATEVKDDLIEELRQLAEDEGLSQVEVVRGDQQNMGLPPRCCGAALLRLVYHHFEDPGPMQQSLVAALQPGGRLLVIDIEPQEDWRVLEDVPDRGGHGIRLEELVAELTAAGFTELERQRHWDGDAERFAVLFAAPLGD